MTKKFVEKVNKLTEKLAKEAQRIDSCMSKAEEEPKEEWVWVEGYKGTDENMQCRGYQYELGTQHDIPDGQDITECVNGFHLCLALRDVFEYYVIGNCNRFFRVQALVRKSDVNKYGAYIKYKDNWGCSHPIDRYDKLVAKSIIFDSECTEEEILRGTPAQDLPKEYQKIAIASDIKSAVKMYHTNTLVEDGYSVAFANHIVEKNKFNVAHAIGTCKDVSMDVKVLYILNN